MAYFNYFLKCIIRNITYKLFKPKFFLTVLLFILIIVLLHNTGYCAEWSDADINFVTNQLNSISQSLNSIYSYDMATYNKLNEMYNSIVVDMKNQSFNLEEILKRIEEINVVLYGTAEKEAINYGRINKGIAINAGGTYLIPGTGTWVYFPYDPQYSYEIYMNNMSSTIHDFQVVLTVENPGTSSSSQIPSFMLNNVLVPSNSKHTYIIGSGHSEAKYVAFNVLPSGMAYMVYRVERFGGVLNSLDNIDKGTQDLNNSMQENNQIQQEQNDFLKQETTDNDVSVDSFNSVDSNDITSSGLTGIFNTIYNSINSWSSKDINLPVPFTNKSINIQANYTSNMLNKVGRSNFN